ncbi:MAG: hypothetical protein ABII07_00810 [Patescibacteria group bacterium]|nr:hypothetical protein [Patescibacteria group bacterium]
MSKVNEPNQMDILSLDEWWKRTENEPNRYVAAINNVGFQGTWITDDIKFALCHYSDQFKKMLAGKMMGEEFDGEKFSEIVDGNLLMAVVKFIKGKVSSALI